MTERRIHPSGRPLPRDRVISIERGRPRSPHEEPLTPRLRNWPAAKPDVGFLDVDGDQRRAAE